MEELFELILKYIEKHPIPTLLLAIGLLTILLYLEIKNNFKKKV